MIYEKRISSLGESHSGASLGAGINVINPEGNVIVNNSGKTCTSEKIDNS